MMWLEPFRVSLEPLKNSKFYRDNCKLIHTNYFLGSSRFPVLLVGLDFGSILIFTFTRKGALSSFVCLGKRWENAAVFRSFATMLVFTSSCSRFCSISAIRWFPNVGVIVVWFVFRSFMVDAAVVEIVILVLESYTFVLFDLTDSSEKVPKRRRNQRK